MKVGLGAAGRLWLAAPEALQVVLLVCSSGAYGGRRLLLFRRFQASGLAGMGWSDLGASAIPGGRQRLGVVVAGLFSFFLFLLFPLSWCLVFLVLSCFLTCVVVCSVMLSFIFLDVRWFLYG